MTAPPAAAAGGDAVQERGTGRGLRLPVSRRRHAAFYGRDAVRAPGSHLEYDFVASIVHSLHRKMRSNVSQRVAGTVITDQAVPGQVRVEGGRCNEPGADAARAAGGHVRRQQRGAVREVHHRGRRADRWGADGGASACLYKSLRLC